MVEVSWEGRQHGHRGEVKIGTSRGLRMRDRRSPSSVLELLPHTLHNAKSRVSRARPPPRFRPWTEHSPRPPPRFGPWTEYSPRPVSVSRGLRTYHTEVPYPRRRLGPSAFDDEVIKPVFSVWAGDGTVPRDFGRGPVSTRPVRAASVRDPDGAQRLDSPPVETGKTVKTGKRARCHVLRSSPTVSLENLKRFGGH
jgi:hypothetical protein